MTPLQWRNETIGKSYDLDGFPASNKYQCWDYFAQFIKQMNLPVSTYCSLTGYVCDLWRLRDKYGYSKYFDYITNPNDLRVGDWAIWDKGSSHQFSHVAMMYLDANGNPVELGQNQGKPYVTEKQTTWDILGAFRFKAWDSLPFGASDRNVNGREYSFYRQNQSEKAIVISAGLNKTLPIRSLDVDADVMCKITGANYFNMDASGKNPDPIGTTYGDISAPMSEVWRQLPNQDTTLYFDLETGTYGDCTGIRINQEHNVFSPSIVFPASGNYQYARMAGIGFANQTSTYTFSIRLTDGTYILGLAKQESTPRQISTDLKELLGAQLESVAFLDGGGSAQMGRVKDHQFEYVRETPRAVPSAVAIIREHSQTDSQTHENEPIQDETQKDEEEPMSEVKPAEQAEKPQETAPAETKTKIDISGKVMSVITIMWTAALLYMGINNIPIPDFFQKCYFMFLTTFFTNSTAKSIIKSGMEK